MKLNYSFSKREIAMILVLILVLVGLLYYRFVYIRIRDQADQYDTTDIEAQIQVEQLQLLEWQKMQDEIDNLGEVSTSSLATYDNQKAEINLLNDIFEPVIRYNFSFEKPVATGDTVRRNVRAAFTTIDYASALEILAKLHNSKYRALLKDISISPGDMTEDYLRALAAEALNDQAALTQLKKQVNTLLAANYPVDSYVLKVYREEPLTEAPETEPMTEPLAEGAEGMEGGTPEETMPEEGAIIEGEEGTVEGEEGAVPEGGTVETLEDGTIVAPQPGAEPQPQSETQTETQTETERPFPTLENSIVNVSLTMTFYETIYGATNLDGLIVEKVETPDTSS